MSVQDIIVRNLLKKVEEEKALPWQKPWKTFNMFPMSGQTGKAYRGMNSLILGLSDYSNPYWFTKKNFLSLGGYCSLEQFKTPTEVVFWKTNTKKDLNRVEKKQFILRYYNVWNFSQIKWKDEELVKKFVVADAAELTSHERLVNCENIAKGYPNPPHINFEGGAAFYRPSTDSIHLPENKLFNTIEDYYNTMYHEMGHSTGHSKRLDRGLDTETRRYGDHLYSFEELVAELTASFLCVKAGIAKKTEDNSVAYLQGWKKNLTDNPKVLFQAASLAQKAYDHILGETDDTSQKEEAPQNGD